MPDYVIETPRLGLREMTYDDVEFVASMLAHPDVMRHYPRCYSLDEAVLWIGRQRERYRLSGYGFWLAVDRATAEPVGQIGLTPPRVEGVPDDDVGYLIHRPHWRKGFASEGGSGVIAYAFGTLERSRVVCLIRPGNGPSQGVALKIGMAREQGRVVELAGLDHWVYARSR